MITILTSQQNQKCTHSLKGTVRVILSDPKFKDTNAQFTTVS